MNTEAKISAFTVEKRTGSRKGAARKLRARGLVPGIVYGSKSEPMQVSFDPTLLKKALDPQKKRNTLLDITVKGEGAAAGERLQALLTDVQIDHVSRAVLHADFLRVTNDKPVRVRVPLLLEGKPEGVKLGGILHQVFRTLEVECLANLIPAVITADVTPLQEDQVLTAGELKLPQGVKVCLPPNRTCAHVISAKAASRAEAAAAAEQSPTAAAAPAEGAAAAPAAAAPAKAAPAAGKSDKKS